MYDLVLLRSSLYSSDCSLSLQPPTFQDPLEFKKESGVPHSCLQGKQGGADTAVGVVST